MTITQADREAAGEFLRSDGCPLNAKMTIHPRALIEAFARHREAAEREAMERALKALKSAKYSPAPYTDGVKAIRAHYAQSPPDIAGSLRKRCVGYGSGRDGGYRTRYDSGCDILG